MSSQSKALEGGNMSSQQSSRTLNLKKEDEKQYFPPKNSKSFKIKINSVQDNALEDEDDLTVAIEALKTYKMQLKNIDAQHSIVDENNSKVSEKNQELLNQLDGYRNELEQMGVVVSEFQSIDNFVSAANIKKIQEKFQTLMQSLEKMGVKLNNDAKVLHDKKRKFESGLNQLEREEKRLNVVRKKLATAQGQMGIVTQFSDNNNLSSRQFYRRISEADLRQVFSQEHVQNVHLHLDSGKNFAEVDIEKNLCVNKLQVTSDGVKFLKINVKNPDCRVFISESSFSGVGLLICRKTEEVGNTNNNVCVVLDGLIVTDAPLHGIRTMYCSDCRLSNSSVKNVLNGSGVIFEHVQNAQISQVEVSECNLQGFYFDHSNGILTNCSTAFCGGYAVCVKENSCVTGDKVFFNSNGGNSVGNFNAV